MMKKTLLILITVVFLFSGYRIFVSPQVKEGSIPYDTIICFGDSLTSGTGADAGMDYPSQPSKMIAKPVINAGLPGDTTGCVNAINFNADGGDGGGDGGAHQRVVDASDAA